MLTGEGEMKEFLREVGANPFMKQVQADEILYESLSHRDTLEGSPVIFGTLLAVYDEQNSEKAVEDRMKFRRQLSSSQ